MKSTEEGECELCELEKLSVEELLELAKAMGIHYDESQIKTIEDYKIIDDLMTSGEIKKLKKELIRFK